MSSSSAVVPLLAGLWLGIGNPLGAQSSPASTKGVRVAVAGPTIVAFFVASPGDSDSESLSDFEFYLGKVAPDLDNAGVKLVVAFADTLYLTWPDGRKQVVSTRDSIGVGYGFTDRRRPLAMEYGVMTDIDLLCEATRRLGVGRLQHWCS